MNLFLTSEALAESPCRYLSFTDLENSDLIDNVDAAAALKSQSPLLRGALGIHFSRTPAERGTKAALDFAALNHRVPATPATEFIGTSKATSIQKARMKFKALCYARLDFFYAKKLRLLLVASNISAS